MSFLVSRVFRDEVEVFAANDERAVHLSRDDCACEDTTSNRDLAGEGAFFVFNGQQATIKASGRCKLPI